MRFRLKDQFTCRLNSDSVHSVLRLPDGASDGNSRSNRIVAKTAAPARFIATAGALEIYNRINAQYLRFSFFFTGGEPLTAESISFELFGRWWDRYPDVFLLFLIALPTGNTGMLVKGEHTVSTWKWQTEGCCRLRTTLIVSPRDSWSVDPVNLHRQAIDDRGPS